jgi:hypothetical protein
LEVKESLWPRGEVGALLSPGKSEDEEGEKRDE